MASFTLVLVSIHSEPGPEAVGLGAACVASAVKRAFPDCALSLVDAYPTERPLIVAERILGRKCDLVGFSLYSWNRTFAVAVAELLRKRSPDLRLFCGGPEATANGAGLALADGGVFDEVLSAEGEPATPAYLARTLGLPIPAPETLLDPLSLGASPWLDGTLGLRKREGILWELARGCPYGCTYCYEAKGDRRVRNVGDERILAELKLFAQSEAESIWVLDPTFNTDAARAVRLLDMIQKEAPNFHWHFEARAEQVDREQAKRFAALGASLQIGLQSAAPEVCARVGRKLNRGLFESKMGILNDEGVVFGLDLMYGLPGDTLAGFRESLDFALSLYPNSIDLFRLSILPGTVLASQAEEFGLAADIESPYLLTSSPTFPQADLAAAERLARAVDFFYNRGRAVPWFNQVLFALGGRASAFFLGFADFMDSRVRGGAWETLLDVPSTHDGGRDPVALERLQLAYLDKRFAGAKKEYLLPAVWDVVRFHGAWARALADGIATDMESSYDLDDVVGPTGTDLEQFAALGEFKPCRVRIVPTQGEPRVSVSPLSAHGQGGRGRR
jgi:radical SAM superfamily enzyme YgiQ (UPF0313 family)